MDNPVDHIVDLGLVNYVKHPTNPNYIVYRFADEERANTFESKLKELGIWYERDMEQKKARDYFLFGIHKNDFKKTERINFDVEAAHKKPFIPYRGFRYFILSLSLIVMVLAVIGYCKQQDTLASVNQIDQSINGE